MRKSRKPTSAKKLRDPFEEFALKPLPDEVKGLVLTAQGTLRTGGSSFYTKVVGEETFTIFDNSQEVILQRGCHFKGIPLLFEYRFLPNEEVKEKLPQNFETAVEIGKKSVASQNTFAWASLEDGQAVFRYFVQGHIFSYAYPSLEEALKKKTHSDLLKALDEFLREKISPYAEVNGEQILMLVKNSFEDLAREVGSFESAERV
jgi:hypothetical protein